MKTYISLFRKLQHQKLSELDFRGSVLDLGGSKKAFYHNFIKNDEVRITVLNINKATGADIIADIEDPLPLRNDTFDMVLAMNVLEHIYNFQGVASESFRVIKPEGRGVFIIPFFAAIHPSPEDYFRYTNTALHKIFKDAGFHEVSVEPLGYGVMSTRFMLFQNFLPRFLHPIFEKIAILEDKILAFIACHLGKKYRPDMYPLGYLVVATKL